MRGQVASIKKSARKSMPMETPNSSMMPFTKTTWPCSASMTMILSKQPTWWSAYHLIRLKRITLVGHKTIRCVHSLICQVSVSRLAASVITISTRNSTIQDCIATWLVSVAKIRRYLIHCSTWKLKMPHLSKSSVIPQLAMAIMTQETAVVSWMSALLIHTCCRQTYTVMNYSKMCFLLSMRLSILR